MFRMAPPWGASSERDVPLHTAMSRRPSFWSRKGRFQSGFVVTDGDCSKPAFMYVRAMHGHTVSFVRMARLAMPPTMYEEFKASTTAVWHATNERSACRIFEHGLLPS